MCRSEMSLDTGTVPPHQPGTYPASHQALVYEVICGMGQVQPPAKTDMLEPPDESHEEYTTVPDGDQWMD